METTHWVHDLNPVLLPIYGNIAIRYYGLAYAIAFFIAFWLLGQFRKRGRSPLTADQEFDAIVLLILGVMIGGRLGFMLLYDLNDFLHNPLIFFQVWHGGMASHGGFAGVILAGWWVGRKTGMGFYRLTDLLVPLTPPGLFLGRIANFINGELWGKISDVPWAVIFPGSAPHGTPVNLIPPRHPSQLYEAGLEGAVLIIYTQLRFWKSDIIKTRPGQLGGEFLLLYSILRILGEGFREPDASLFFGVSRGIFYSILMGSIGALLIYGSIARSKKPNNKKR